MEILTTERAVVTSFLFPARMKQIDDYEVSENVQSRIRAAIATIVFVCVLPGPVIFLVPWFLSRWQVREPFLGWSGFRWIGAILILGGVPVLGDAMVRFVREGRGTPAAILPTDQLVVTGLYRYVRNPMYIGVLALILGQGLLLGNTNTIFYALCVAIAFHLFVRLYEEPTLRRKYGSQYDAYCREVPRWLLRFSPWSPEEPKPR